MQEAVRSSWHGMLQYL